MNRNFPRTGFEIRSISPLFSGKIDITVAGVAGPRVLDRVFFARTSTRMPWFVVAPRSVGSAYNSADILIGLFDFSRRGSCDDRAVKVLKDVRVSIWLFTLMWRGSI